MESRSDETTGRLPPNIRARSDGAIATEWRPTECDALCIWCFCGDSQFPQLINNKKTRARPGSELRFATVLAIVCRPTLRRFAPSLRALFSFFTIPGVPRLRRSTPGSIEIFWYIALVRCTIEHNGEGTKGSPPIVPEERRRPNPGLGLYPNK